MLLTNFHPQTNAATTFKFLFNFKHGREEKVGLFWHSGRRNYVIANKVRSLKLHLNRDRARVGWAVWVARAGQVCFRGNNKPLSEGGETREPGLATYQHTVLSALEKFGGKLPRTQWESSVPNRLCQNTSWFSVGHKKSNFPLLKYSFHLCYGAVISWI